MARIVLAEDHLIFREGLKALLDRKTDLSVVAETGDGLEALDLIQIELPDILIVDLSLPGLDGLEVTRRTKKLSPSTRIIILSMHDSDEYVVRAFRNGAHAYVLKNESMVDLEKAIRAVLHGRPFLSTSLALDPPAILDRSDSGEIQDPYETLTKREREILQLVAEGYTSPDIADRLFISLQTVNKHRSNVMDKLGRRSQTQLVHFAIQRGLVHISKNPPTKKS